MGKVSPVTNTLRDYSEAATVHGVSYVFSRSLPLVDRLVWGLITLTCLSLAAYWSITAYGNWQENMVVTSLKDPAMSVTNLPFPAVTICTSGLDMAAVKDKLMKDFDSWKMEAGKTSIDKEEDKAHLEEYMMIKFEIEDISSKNIFDIVKALSSPDPGKTMKSLSVLERVIACSKQGERKTTNRKKRLTSSESAQIFPFQHEGDVYARVAVPSGNRMSRDVVVATCKSKGMRPFCRYNNRGASWDKECARGNLPRHWDGKDRVENIDILSRMKCNHEHWKCPELLDIFFHMKNELQSLGNEDAGQNEVSAMYGSLGVVAGGWKVDGVKYTSTDDQPLYAACVQEAGKTLKSHDHMFDVTFPPSSSSSG